MSANKQPSVSSSMQNDQPVFKPKNDRKSAEVEKYPYAYQRRIIQPINQTGGSFDSSDNYRGRPKEAPAYKSSASFPEVVSLRQGLYQPAVKGEVPEDDGAKDLRLSHVLHRENKKQ